MSENQAMSVDNISTKIINYIPKNKGTEIKILDIATGQGYLLPVLSGQGYTNIYSADLNGENFKQDKVKYNFTQVDANVPLPFDDGFFDVIITSETIEHVESPIGFLRDLKRILKDDGTLIMTTPNVQTIFSRIYFLFAGGLAAHEDSDFKVSGHITVLPEWSIRRFCEMLDLKIEARTYNCAYFPIIKVKLFNNLLNILFGWISIWKISKNSIK
jgi:SAM-dependent methyltransferase